MGVTVSGTAPPSARSAAAPHAAFPRWFEDYHGWIAGSLYLGLALFFQRSVIEHITTVCNCYNTDPIQWMWAWEYIPYALLHGENPLVTNAFWYPDKTDLAAVTLAPISAVPGAPLEAVFGPIAAYNLLCLACPVMSGWAAYRLCRYLTRSPWPAMLAGYAFGFSSYELGQGLGHIHLMFVFTVPLLVLVVMRYIDEDISRRRAIASSTILLIIQLGLSSEIMLDLAYLGAVTLGVALIVDPVHRRRLIGAIIVLVAALVITAAVWSYYIVEELRGPVVSAGVGSQYPADLLSYVIPNKEFRLGANRMLPVSNAFFTADTFEQNSYLGLPLAGIFLAFTFRYWRRPVVKIVALGSFVAFVLSLGVVMQVDGHATYTMPFDILIRLPLVKLSLPSRLGLFVGLGACVAAALWITWAETRRARIWRWVVGLAAVAFLLPNLPATEELSTYVNPAFFTHGLYRRYIAPNESVLTLPNAGVGTEMLWQAETHMDFKLIDGYFGNGPDGYGITGEGQALIAQLSLNEAEPAPVYARELRSLAGAYHVRTVLVEDSTSGQWTTGVWPSAVTRAGFHLDADVGGIQVYKLNG